MSVYAFERTRSTNSFDTRIRAAINPRITPSTCASTAMYTVRHSASAKAWSGWKIRCQRMCHSNAASTAGSLLVLLLQREGRHVPLRQDALDRAVRVHRRDRLLDAGLRRRIVFAHRDADRNRVDRRAGKREGRILLDVIGDDGRVTEIGVDFARLECGRSIRVVREGLHLDRGLALRLQLLRRGVEEVFVRRADLDRDRL